MTDPKVLELIEAANQVMGGGICSNIDCKVPRCLKKSRLRAAIASLESSAAREDWIENVHGEVWLAEHKIDQYLQGQGPGTVRLGVALQASRRALLLLPTPPSTAPQKENSMENREEKADRFIKLSGKEFHASDCSTSIAPAEEPGPCDCDFMWLFSTAPKETT